MSGYPYWFHQILYPSTRQYVTIYVDVFHSGDIGQKKRKWSWSVRISNAFKSATCGRKGSILRNKSIPAENYLGKHMANKNTSKILSSQILPQKFFCPIVNNFKIWNPPVPSSSHLSSVTTELSFYNSLHPFPHNEAVTFTIWSVIGDYKALITVMNNYCYC